MLRLQVLAKVFNPATAALLDRLKVSTGMVCFDVGCGHGAVSHLLAARVGPTGHVVAIDRDAVVLADAQANSQAGGSTITFQQGDITALSMQESFDLVYARFVLSHLRDPCAVLRSMVDAVRTGGLVLVEDLDSRCAASHPALSSYMRYTELYRAIAERRGAHPYIGPELVAMFRKVGLREIGVHAYLPIFAEGTEKTLSRLTVEAIAPAVIEQHLATKQEIAMITHDLLRYESDSSTLLSSFLTYQVWGRKK